MKLAAFIAVLLIVMYFLSGKETAKVTSKYDNPPVEAEYINTGWSQLLVLIGWLVAAIIAFHFLLT